LKGRKEGGAIPDLLEKNETQKRKGNAGNEKERHRDVEM
jgi:hypothetical protein